MRKILRYVLYAVLAAVLGVSTFYIIRTRKETDRQEKLYESLQTAVAGKEPISAAESEPVMLPEYAELYRQNSDLVGWIRIEDTNINYPVVQSKDEPNFYLKHGFDKEYADCGCPYVQENCDVQKPSDNLVIYGHHMKSGSMFADLERFKDKDFQSKHRTVFFDTLYERQTYEIIAVFKTAVYTGSENEFQYCSFVDAAEPEQFDEYIRKVKERALYDTGISAAYGDKLITLSTCEYSNRNGRLVLVAKRVTEKGGGSNG